MSSNVTKNFLAKTIFYETGLPVAMTEKFLDSLFNNIIEHARNDRSIKIPKFGSFYVKEKSPRIGRNLNTQTSITIDARKVISFRPSNQLKQAINEQVQ